MKTLATIIGTLAPATSFAASSLSEDNSGLFVWIFLGFCALIIAAQMIPAALMLFGIVKGVAGKVEAKENARS